MFETMVVGMLGMMGAWLLLILLGYIFWLWMFIDALANRDLLWIFLFIFSFFTGFLPGIIALVYFFVAYGKHRKHRHW